MDDELKTCLLCEAQGDDYVEATKIIEFNGDFIPVCDTHYDLLNKSDILDMLDE